ncbi:hypothetical protein RND81_13G052400 [Saponaria officinalis]|uniref:Protein kinase domain-containing protein n=1 Tax=Saponaria officinalis TaxID=3572 RepID=A0AAW1GXR0_SAPOF
MMMRVATIMVVLSTAIMSLSAQGVNGDSTYCESSISNACAGTSLTTGCCSAVRYAANYNRGCFCTLIQSDQNRNPGSAAYYARSFALCSVDGTVSTLCPGSNTVTHVTRYTPPSSSSLGSKMPIIIGIIVALVLVVTLILATICIRRRKRKPDLENSTHFEPNVANNSQDVLTKNKISRGHLPANTAGTNKDGSVIPESLQYEFEDIQTATNNFSKDNKIGRGGFGIVYKGALSNGQEVAVKRLSNGSGQGDKEFQTEVLLLAKLQHRNLVKLLGFCLVDDEALLVYEFVPNKSLDYFLYDSEKRVDLNWSCRFEIIKGVAQGMKYLHEDSPMRTMHRDLKSGNVLLDAEMRPKIADFGLARICDVGQTHINPTRVVGTHGYMAPEYLFHGQFSAKSDVYAFGVLILEIVAGRRIGGSSFNQPGGEGLLSFAWRCWEDEKPLEIMDPLLKDSCSSDEVVKCVQLGLLCVQENSNLRPKMSTIVDLLDDSYSGDASIPMPQHPAYIYSGSSHQSTTVSSSKGNLESLVTTGETTI